MDPYRMELASSILVLKSYQSRLYARESHDRRARLGSDGSPLMDSCAGYSRGSATAPPARLLEGASTVGLRY